MRHNKSGRKLNRNSSHRKAMFKNMARAVFAHETIRTTEAKAKELRAVVDGLITLALKDDLQARRQAFKVLGNHKLVQHLFDNVGPRYAGGQGGYTRIVKLANVRPGDAAPMVIFELTKLAEKKTEAPAAETTKPRPRKTRLRTRPRSPSRSPSPRPPKPRRPPPRTLPRSPSP